MLGLIENAAVGGSTYGVDFSTTNYLSSAPSLTAGLISLDAQTKALNDAHLASWYTFKSASPAASHSISHNLNSEFVEVQLWVKNPDDGLYRMDIAEVIEHDFNTVEVVMNASRDVKVIIEKRYA